MSKGLHFKALDRGRYVECDVPQRTPEWKALRAGKLTGSVFGAALDVNKNKSSRQTQRDIDNQRKFRGNKFTNHGTFYEPYAIAKYEAALGVTVREMGFAFPHKLPFIGVSPDGLVEYEGRDILLEVKCPCTRPSYNDEDDKGIPEYYMAQVQGVMAVLGLPTCHFVVYRPDNYADTLEFTSSDFDYRERDESPVRPWRMEVWNVPANTEYQKVLFKGLRWFWAQVIGGVEIPTKRSGLLNYNNPHKPALLAVETERTLLNTYGPGAAEGAKL